MISTGDVIAMLSRHSDLITEHYGHIKQPFTKAEVQDFLDGKPGKEVKPNYFRSYQITQAVSAIGAYHVDRNEQADPATYKTYKAVWQLTHTAKCDYCRKPFAVNIMMDNPGHCTKPKCVLSAMRAGI